jgi:hypothetical protein
MFVMNGNVHDFTRESSGGSFQRVKPAILDEEKQFFDVMFEAPILTV